MSRIDRSRKLESEVSRNLRLGFDTDESLANAAERIAEAEATFRKLAEPRLRG